MIENMPVEGWPHALGPLGACLDCIGAYKLAVARKEDGDDKVQIPPVYNAVTLCPSWQNTSIMGQMIVACVAVPTCAIHIGVTPKSAQQRAVESGLIIPGS